jgi:hypothetical protein
MYPVGTPDPADPSGVRGLVVRDVRSEIWVNRGGERFHDEDLRGGLTGMPALLAQPGQTAWGIFDARQAARLTLLNDPSYGSPFVTSAEGRARFWRTSSHAWQAASIAGLAAATGLPQVALSASVGSYKDWIGSGLTREPRFGRELAGLEPISEPPFCAVQYFPLVQKNLGGVRTDAAGRVRRAAEGSIPGLYAAGEVAGWPAGASTGRAPSRGRCSAPACTPGGSPGRPQPVRAGSILTVQKA